MSKSAKIFLGLLTLYALSAGLSLYLPMGDLGALMPQIAPLPASKIIMVLASAGIIFVSYGFFGFVGVYLSKKLNWPQIWDGRVSNRQRFLIPMIVGVIGGIILIVGDLIFSQFNNFGRFVHPPFPTSLVASFTAGVGEEIIFRLFFISFWVWLISLLTKKRWSGVIFWIVAVISALVFAAGHYPALMLLLGYDSILQIPIILHLEIILLNSLIALASAYYFRKYGFLAAAGVHFWTDVVWHVVWGLL